MKRWRFYCFMYFDQHTDFPSSEKLVKLHNWPIIGSQLLVLCTTAYFLWYQDCHLLQQQFVFNIEMNGSVKIISETWDYFQIRVRLGVTNMHAGNRCWQIMTRRTQENRESANEMYKEDPTQGIPTAFHSLSRWPGEVCLAHSSDGENSDSDGDASKVETKWKQSVPAYFSKKTKEIWSANSRVSWQHLSTILCEGRESRNNHQLQSPVRCRGTRSHHSVDTTRVKLERHRGRWRNFWKLAQPNKRRDIFRIISIWIEWKVVVRFSEMLLLSAK